MGAICLRLRSAVSQHVPVGPTDEVIGGVTLAQLAEADTHRLFCPGAVQVGAQIVKAKTGFSSREGQDAQELVSPEAD
jgi:hypothetical protein